MHWFMLSGLAYLASRFVAAAWRRRRRVKARTKPLTKVLDLKGWFRCRGCGARGQAVVLVKWAPQCESQVLDTLAERLRSYRITAEASFQIAT
jgi:hypothetical protein